MGEQIQKTVYCRFGDDQPFEGRAITSTAAFCVSPPQRAGNMTLELSSNMLDFSTSGVAFEFLDSSMLQSCEPSTGTVAGSVSVTIRGLAFPQQGTMLCRFGRASVTASMLNSTHAVCVSPEHIPGRVQLTLANDDGLESENFVYFDFVQVPEISRLIPSSGSLLGGTALTVVGLYFQEESPYCRFSGHAIRGEVISSTVMRCISPEWPIEADVSVEVSVNGIEFNPGLLFTFTQPAIVAEVYPRTVHVTGGETLTVYGKNFLPSSAFVGIGDEIFQSVFLTSSMLTCTTQQRPWPGNVTVAVSNNEADFSSNVLLEFAHETLVRELRPSRVSATGGTFVTLVGSGFSGSSIIAQFGESNVDCSVISEGSAVCEAPQNKAGLVEVAVQGNPTNLVLELYPEQVLEEVSPSTGPVSGCTLLRLVGLNFIDAETKCVLDRDRSIPVTTLSSTLVLAVSPSRAHGMAEIGCFATVPIDGVEGSEFLYHSPVELTRIFPQQDYLLDRRGTITVYGTGFGRNEERPQCIFGSISLVAGVLRSSSSVQCALPELQPGKYSVGITYNGEDISNEELIFTMLNSARTHILLPSLGQKAGGTSVTVIGTDFARARHRCIFGEDAVPGVQLSSSAIRCRSPVVKQPGAVDFRLMLADGKRVDGDLSFLFHLDLELKKALPSSGSVSGGTPITVMGQYFEDTETLSCHFGTLPPEDAQYISSTQVLCLSPRLSDVESEVALFVSLNAQDRASDSVTFQVQPIPQVISVKPTKADGATVSLITVMGRHFASTESLCCSFGSHVSPAMAWLSPQLVVCQTDMINSGNVTVEVSNNCADFSTDGLSIVLLRPILVHAVEPSEGWQSGGFSIRVLGSGFQEGATATCHFGDERAPASVLDTEEVVCLVPSTDIVGLLDFYVSFPELGATSNKVAFESHVNPLVLALVPSVGFTDGGTAVTMYGYSL
eukprot:3936153-Rhodomonas_salina.1